jgi:hypothetical protein
MCSKFRHKGEYIFGDSYKPTAWGEQQQQWMWKVQRLQYQTTSWHHRPKHSKHNDQHKRSIITNKQSMILTEKNPYRRRS